MISGIRFERDEGECEKVKVAGVQKISGFHFGNWIWKRDERQRITVGGVWKFFRGKIVFLFEFVEETDVAFFLQMSVIYWLRNTKSEAELVFRKHYILSPNSGVRAPAITNYPAKKKKKKHNTNTQVTQHNGKH